MDGAWANTPNWPDSGFIFLLRLGCWALARGGLEIKGTFKARQVTLNCSDSPETPNLNP